MKDTPLFATTKWSVLERERADGRGTEWLCENYREPVLARFRIRCTDHVAEDLCHDFFQKQVIEGRLVERADRHRGNLRGLLRTALMRFSISQARRRVSMRRGGGAAAARAGND